MSGGIFRLVQLSFVYLLLFSVRCGIGTALNRGYIFTAPNVFLAGETESACLSLHNLEPPAYISLQLLSTVSSEEEVLVDTNTILETGVETCLELPVPETKYSSGRLRLTMKFEKYPDYVVNNEKGVYIEQDSLITIVETDKPVYKPGQDVKMRILMLRHDLKPWKKPVPKVWIENPSEVRVAQWSTVSTTNGLAQLEFPLSREPNVGTWKIKVQSKLAHPRLVHTTVFEVKKYVLPRFQVTIFSPGYILADSENVTWNICAKYSYGKPVKGTLLLKSTAQTPTWRRKLNLPEIHFETEVDSPDGCTEFVLSGTVLGLSHWKVAPNNIVLIANFTETGTGVVETAISRTVVVHQALKLKFVPYSPKYFKLGLPYHGKLRVLHQDDRPAPNEKIQVCLSVQGKDEWHRVYVECRNFTSSANGFVDFIVPPPHKNIVVLSFIGTGVDYPTKYYSPDKRWRVFMEQPSAYIDVNPWFSPSDSYLAVSRGYQPIICGEKYSFNVMYTVPASNNYNESISFHYSINSKGDLMIYGHVKHKPSRETVLNYSEFRNLLGAVETPANKTDPGTTVHRFPLSVKVTPSMAPISELLLYYVRPDGEIVATTYTIDVGHCFENKVKTAWHTDAKSPGTTTKYHIEAAPWSLCGVSAVDKSTLFLAGYKANLVNADQTFDQLKRFHPKPDPQPMRTWTHCKSTTQVEIKEFEHLPNPDIMMTPWKEQRRKRHSLHYGLVNYVDAIQAFDDFGAVVMSDLIIETRPCPQLFRGHGVPWYNINMMSAGPDEPDLVLKSVKTMPMAFPLRNFDAAIGVGPELGYVDQLPDQSSTTRSYFPETWLWELVPTGKDGKVTIERVLPDTITDWIGHTVCVSTYGLGVAPPTTITAFQPFFLDYSLPYSVKRGEMLRMKVSLFNYMQHSLPVRIKLEDGTGLDLHLSHPTASFCVKPRDSVVHEYMLRPRVLGDVNITVSAEIDPDYTEPCGPETLIYTRDVIVRPILVLPEGFPLEVTNSAFICPKDFSDDSTVVWQLDLPDDVVPESARGYVTLIGDLLGPALENLKNLLRLPVGCGEQNMILFVPNIHVINYLDAIGVSNPELKAKAIKNMEKGYQRELIYRHRDGSYSAFGPESSETGSSIWLTAFVVKSFAQARGLIHIDERDLKMSVIWIVKQQLENGCFPVVGTVFHREMKGGLHEEDSSSPALTAYILIALLQSDVPLAASVINNALYCLEKGFANNNSSPYTAALSTYALTLLDHFGANNSMLLLMDRSTRHRDMLWWEDKSKPSLSLSIEMTAYAILSLVKLGGDANMVEALKAVRWMSKQRNAEGGFVSTQDTVLGLEALTKYAAAMSTNTTDLSILITAGEIDHVYRMHSDNRMVLTQIRLPVLPTIIEIFAEGEGCVLVQSNIKYNVAHATGSEAFDLSVVATSVAFIDECSMQELMICVRYKMADEESNMALLDINMISGYVPDRASLHTLLENPSTRVKRFEEERDTVTIYFDKLIGQKTCISFSMIRENIVERLEPANVKLYDYYQPELQVSSSYSFAQICSSADVPEDHPIPNPMPIELIGTLGKNQPMDELSPSMDQKNSSADNKTIDASTKNMDQTNFNIKKKIPSELNNKPIATGKVIELVEKLSDKVTEKSVKRQKGQQRIETQTTGTTPKSYNINIPLLKVWNVKQLNNDKHETAANIHKPNDNTIISNISDGLQAENGSGQAADETEGDTSSIFGHTDSSIDLLDYADNFPTTTSVNTDEPIFYGNPSFTIVSHELDTPDGNEGPIPVYVKPNNGNYENRPFLNVTDYKTDSIYTDELYSSKPPPNLVMENNKERDPDEDIQQFLEGRPEMMATNTTDADTIQLLVPITQELSCPICDNKLPSNISNLYCKANSVIKVAIRRLRKARLLLDLYALRDIKRLRSTVELILNPGCTCAPLDNPGSLALIIQWIQTVDNNTTTFGNQNTQVLDDSIYVYTLPSTSGIPRKVIEARSICPIQDTHTSTNTEYWSTPIND